MVSWKSGHAGKCMKTKLNLNIWILDFVCKFCNSLIYTLLFYMRKSVRKLKRQKMEELPLDKLQLEPHLLIVGLFVWAFLYLKQMKEIKTVSSHAYMPM